MANVNKVLPKTAAKVKAALETTDGHQGQAAELLGMSKRRVQQIIKVMRDTGHEVRPSPHDLTGFYRPNQANIHGTSTLLGANGDVKLQWVKEKAGVPTPEEMALVIKAALGEVPVCRVIPPPKDLPRPGLLNVFPMGDPHIGMYSWAEETGQDFDLDIAETQLTQAMGYLVGCCPPAEQALIVNVGDFFHADNMENRTMRSGNVLDVDTRWAKVLRVGVRAMRACIEHALTRHMQVRVINEIGNHDDHSSQMLTIALAMFYENNPRVSFDESPARFHYYRFGKVLIGVTHGDNTKPDALGPIMATDRPVDWGETLHRYWYTGHIHHKKVIELPGCMTESFRTLAARDAWHSGKGYRSGRDMTAIVLDENFGEVQRHRIDISMLEKLYGAGPDRKKA
jgi:Bacterial regulatory protein, Fis family